MITIFTDGGNSAKNKVGGCAAIITKNNQILAELSDAYEGEHITNNVMELSAVILGCQYILDHPELGTEVTIVSDSEYVVNGSTTWLPKWKLKKWKTTTGEVKNQTLWEAIDYLKSVLKITFKWTRGHNGNQLNELADTLAVASYEALLKNRKLLTIPSYSI